MSIYSGSEEDFQLNMSDAHKKFYPKGQYLSMEEKSFCCEYARFKMGTACLQFAELVKEIGEIELAQKLSEFRSCKLRSSGYYSEQELFQEILDMRS